MGEGNVRRQLYLRLALRAVIAIAIVFLLTHGAPYIFTILAPFFYALLVALLLNPLIVKLNEKLGLPRRFLALLLVVLVISALLGLVGWLAYIGVSELILLANNLNNIWESVTAAFASIGSRAHDFMEFLPGDTDIFFGGFMDNVYNWLNTSIGDAGNYLLTRTPYFTTRLGGGVIDTIVFILASYFITAEYPALKKMMIKHSGGSTYKFFQMLKASVKVAFGGYIKAQLILASIAFVIVFPALFIMGQEYAFLIALLVAFLDFIPLLGASTLFVPWAIVVAIDGNYFYAAFLVLLSFTFFFIRRIMEPKVMGSQTGLHPLAALLSIYVGWRVFGVLGAILGPIVVMVALNLIAANVFEAAVNDIKALTTDCKKLLSREERE